jgi:hypothetical protein
MIFMNLETSIDYCYVQDWLLRVYARGRDYLMRDKKWLFK